VENLKDVIGKSNVGPQEDRTAKRIKKENFGGNGDLSVIFSKRKKEVSAELTFRSRKVDLCVRSLLPFQFTSPFGENVISFHRVYEHRM